MKEIKYIAGGDALNPIGEGNKFLFHCCNTLGVMGSGFVVPLCKKWPNVRKDYVAWYKNNGNKLFLGAIQTVKVEKDLVVVNIIGQEGVGYSNGIPPIRYDAMKEGLRKVCELAKKHNASVHAPYLVGCSLAGGKWETMEQIINEELCSRNIDVTLYDIDDLRGMENDKSFTD